MAVSAKRRLMIDQIRKFAMAGYGVDDIAVKTGRSRPVVMAIARNYGIWPDAWLGK